jgi:uncharacterized peroxidase-related enzyme
VKVAGRSTPDAEALVAALSGQALDSVSAALAPADEALLAYAEKLTRTPGAMTSTDVSALRDHGLTDRAIHDACAIAAYFAFVNRIADGLGVDLESVPGAPTAGE